MVEQQVRTNRDVFHMEHYDGICVIILVYVQQDLNETT